MFDIIIDGISLVTNYRSAYGQAIRSKGVDGLISSLSEMNAFTQ
ncbi:MAG: ABC transporter substrate-binding protein [Gammaproteobacteria bacterium]|nr:ABC transporter substrate-binding protein [Gammaproteobacteria bacterium]MDH3466400.1 ABC transporter substrate-binding protein [Gammaproteobacteria bacterium]